MDDVFEDENPTRYKWLMQLEVTMQKAGEILYLKANKLQRR